MQATLIPRRRSIQTALPFEANHVHQDASHRRRAGGHHPRRRALVQPPRRRRHHAQLPPRQGRARQREVHRLRDRYPRCGADGRGRHAGLRPDLGALRRLQLAREEGPAHRAHRSDPAGAGGRRCAGRPGARRGRRDADAARVRPEQEAARPADRHRRRVQRRTVELRAGPRQPHLGAHQPPARQAEPLVHEHLLADRRRRRRARDGRRPDRRRQPLGAEAVRHRERPGAHADPRLGRRERHRQDPGGPAGHVQRAVVPRPAVHRLGRAGAPQLDDAEQRRELHGGGVGVERGRQAAARHDGEREARDGECRRRADGSVDRAAVHAT